MRNSQATRGFLFVVLAVAALSAAPGSGARTGSVERFSFGQSRGQYVPGEVIVGLRAHASRADVARVHARVPARVAQRFEGLRMQVLRLGPGMSVQEAIRKYELDPAVAFAEPNYLRSPQSTPTDNLIPDLWGLNNTGQSHPITDFTFPDNGHPSTADADIDAPEAWDTQQGNGTVVAVIDTGVDVSHPDLSGQLWTNPGESGDCSGVPCETNGVDDDDNGLVDDVHGWDFGDGDNTLVDGAPHFDSWEHGSHVAGTIAGAANNNGIVGVCPGCKIMVLKIADNNGALATSAELAAINYAEAHGVKIANMSFGGPDWANSEREAIRTSGLLAVVSAGNDALDNDMYLGADLDSNGTQDVFSPSYPASFTLSNILAVGASNDEDRNGYLTECAAFWNSRAKCGFTNWGHDSVDLAAPGVDIESSIPGGSWVTWDGTSMAAPHVAGVAGLVLSQHPTYTVSELKNALMRSVNKPATLRTIYTPNLTANGVSKSGFFSRTAGRVNANTALGAATTNATPLTDGNINGARAMSKASVSGSVSWPADINDVRKKKLRRGHRYRVTLVVPAHKDYDLFVWKPGTKEIWQIPGGTNFARLAAARATPKNGADEVVTFKARSTGVYYIHVSAWLFKSGSYKLTVKRLS